MRKKSILAYTNIFLGFVAATIAINYTADTLVMFAGLVCFLTAIVTACWATWDDGAEIVIKVMPQDDKEPYDQEKETRFPR